jgi:hypothetical protein
MFANGSIVQFSGVVGFVVGETEGSYLIRSDRCRYAAFKGDVKPFPLKNWPSKFSACNVNFAMKTRNKVKVPGWDDDLILGLDELDDGEYNVYTTTFPIKEGAEVVVYSVPRLIGLHVVDDFEEQHATSPNKKDVNDAFVANLPSHSSRSRVLALDSHEGGTTRALRSAHYRGKIIVPNPGLEELEGATVVQVCLHQFVLSLTPTQEYVAMALDACCKIENLMPVIERLLMGQNLQWSGTLWITFSVRGIMKPDAHVDLVRAAVVELALTAGYVFTCVYLKRYNKIGAIIFTSKKGFNGKLTP